jgi:hypothetical protein
MQPVGVVSGRDRQQRVRRQRQGSAIGGVERIILLRCGDGDDGIVAVVTAGQENAHQRLVGVLPAASAFDIAPMAPRAVTDWRLARKKSRLERISI